MTRGRVHWAARHGRAAEVVLSALLLAGVAAVMAGGFRAPGSEFDEGRLVTFPDRILHGAVPYRDFESFYGPANTYLVAGVFKVFGSSLGAERAVGLVFRLLAVFALFLLGRRFGRTPAFAAALIGAAFLAGSVAATAQSEARALTLLSLAVAAAAVSPRRPSRPGWWLLASGLLGGCALLFRLELAPAVILSALPLLLLRKREGLAYYATGLVVGLLPYIPIAIVVGSGKLQRNFDDLRQTGHDRRLPLPGLSSEGARLLVVSLAATVLLLGVGLWQTRARRADPNARLLLAAGVFALLVAPFAFSRADTGHIIAAGTVPLSFLPMVAASLAGRSRRRIALAGGVTAFLLLFLLATHAVRGNLHRNLQLDLGEKIGTRVSYGGRSFIIDSKGAAGDLQRIVNAVGARATPGQRLFVGSRDLRRTNRNDVFVYYLLPRLEPASFYVELDPPASRPGGPLPGELRRTDYLILTNRWDHWTEPNASRDFGSPAANEVVRAHFCLIDRSGTYQLLRRCR